jgi:hypothetical protein
MSDRYLPVRPGLDQLRHQARDLLRALRSGDAMAAAELRKQLRFVVDETMHEYRDVTPLGWGQSFQDQDFVSKPALRLIAERGGMV